MLCAKIEQIHDLVLSLRYYNFEFNFAGVRLHPPIFKNLKNMLLNFYAKRLQILF